MTALHYEHKTNAVKWLAIERTHARNFMLIFSRSEKMRCQYFHVLINLRYAIHEK